MPSTPPPAGLGRPRPARPRPAGPDREPQRHGRSGRPAPGPQDLVGADRRARPVPVHAAGYHGSPARATRSVFSRVVSSYATSLTSLRQAITSQAPEHPPDGAVPGTLAVAMPRTPALGPAGDLPCAIAEMEAVVRRFPMAVTLAGAAATRAAALAAIKNASIAHFGCHATSCPPTRHADGCSSTTGPSPSPNCRHCPAWRRGLAFLSACDRPAPGATSPTSSSTWPPLPGDRLRARHRHSLAVPDDITLARDRGLLRRSLGPDAAGTRTRPPPCTPAPPRRWQPTRSTPSPGPTSTTAPTAPPGYLPGPAERSA